MVVIVNHIKLTLVKMLLSFLNDVIKEIEYCSKVIVTKFDNPLVMTEKYNSTKCWICKKSY